MMMMMKMMMIHHHHDSCAGGTDIGGAACGCSGEGKRWWADNAIDDHSSYTGFKLRVLSPEPSRRHGILRFSALKLKAPENPLKNPRHLALNVTTTSKLKGP